MNKSINELRKQVKRKQKELSISDETLSSMKRFFLKTSVPRIIEEKRKETAS